MEVVEITPRGGPLVMSMPHTGTGLPKEIAARLNAKGRELTDTDWWIDRLYDFASAFEATTVKANLSRYVIDLNRNPGGQSLYPGQATTALCPTETFDGEPIYDEGAAPTPDETSRRKAAFFDPYHDALARMIERAKVRHGFVVLYDCHSIRSVVPRLFEGTLPTINIGTNDGKTCAKALEVAAFTACKAQSDFSFVANGRFKGGWITRHYGRPDKGVHAIQVELAQSAYMEERPPWTFDETKAGRLRAVLRSMIGSIMDAADRHLRPAL